jgi:rhamnulokinase
VSSRLVAAVDLGASSGRVMAGRVGPDELRLVDVHRFPNEPVRLPDGLHWDILRLYREVLTGLRELGRSADDVVSVGVDSWGVDFGVVDAAGSLIVDPFHYRDGRAALAVDVVHAAIPPERLYERTGVQFLPFNTIYQLAAARGTTMLDAADSMLLIPDLIGYWLSGERVTELTNASTTVLLDVDRGAWAMDVAEAAGIPTRILGPLATPGQVVGPLRDDVRAETGSSDAVRYTLVGSHDTASAVVGVPATEPGFAYIACGTWGLVGVELEAPVLTEASRLAGFTNEGGVDGRIRYLRNVVGLWLLQESIRTWELEGERVELDPLLAAAAALPSGGPTIDPNDPVFLPPDGMPARIAAACETTGQPPPRTRPELVRCILDSLAAAFGRAVRDAERLSGVQVKVVHLVGGGARNEPLCQLTADACEVPVIAGPVEATALGNILVQARAHGLIEGDLSSLRARIRATQDVRVFQPRSARQRSRA